MFLQPFRSFFFDRGISFPKLVFKIIESEREEVFLAHSSEVHFMYDWYAKLDIPQVFETSREMKDEVLMFSKSLDTDHLLSAIELRKDLLDSNLNVEKVNVSNSIIFIMAYVILS